MRLFSLTCGLLFAVTGMTDDGKQPVPDAAAQKTALATVRDVFKAEYAAKIPEKRIKFARTLIQQAMDTPNDLPAQFVLLREAEEIAAGVGEVETALRAASELCARFDVDSDKETFAVLEKLTPAAKSADSLRTIVDETMSLARRSFLANDFDQALARAALAEKAANKSKDTPTVNLVRKAKEEVTTAKARFTSIAKSMERVKQMPNDAEAHLDIGRFESFLRNNWTVGLPHLAQGSDPALKALAEKTLQVRVDANTQAEIAGGWWDVAQKLNGLERDIVREYSAELYRAALPSLTGLPKTRAEKRLAEVERAGAKVGRRPVDLLALIDPKRDSLQGTWRIDKNVLYCDAGNFVPKIQIPYQPPEEYDFMVTFLQPRLRNGVSLVMPNKHGESFYWCVGLNSGADCTLSLAPAPTTLKIPLSAPIGANTVHTTVVQVRRDGIKALVDGQVLFQRKTDCKDLLVDSWRTLKDKSLLAVTCDDPTVFHSIQVLEISGPGKRVR